MKKDELKIEKDKFNEILKGVYKELYRKEKTGATKSATINQIIIHMEKVLKDAN